MPKSRPAPGTPVRAVDAILDRVLRELASPTDPTALNQMRAEFRKKVPFHLRSYAAALLVLEAARTAPSEGGRGNRGNRRREEPRRDETRREEKKAGEPRRERQAPEDARPEEPRPRFSGEGATIFFGMGKRQRLYPRVLLRLLSEEGGLALEDIGDIRAFDNYAFADVDPDKAEELIAALDGVDFRGRPLPVSRARKRGEAAPASEPAGGRGQDRDDRVAEDDGFDDEAYAHPSDDESVGGGSEGGESLDDEGSYDDEPLDGEDSPGDDEASDDEDKDSGRS
ncbi:MAG: DbpA RNA binding domain-containing protein [Spirochaetaceae bacterium]|nr:DbpA RNA binding domain-containing protein [Spirochaetaceae bacterium]